MQENLHFARSPQFIIFQLGACHQHLGSTCQLGLKDGLASRGALVGVGTVTRGGSRGAEKSLPSCPSDVGVAPGNVPCPCSYPEAQCLACQVSMREVAT